MLLTVKLWKLTKNTGECYDFNRTTDCVKAVRYSGVEMELRRKKVTIEDIANALGCSKTTVSRALSGKGRIGENTREQILNYAKSCGYKPNAAAKALAEKRSFNVGVVLPGDSELMEIPFFQSCLLGIYERASGRNHDVLVVMDRQGQIDGLQRIAEKEKAGGVILTRSVLGDPHVAYLLEKQMPFVVIGSCEDRSILQVDNHHVEACREITAYLTQSMKKPALIGGSEDYVVNRRRLRGFTEGIESQRRKVRMDLIYQNCITRTQVEEAVRSALEKQADGIVCMDDKICGYALHCLDTLHVRIPRDIRVASFYSSPYLDNCAPGITSLKFHPKELGSAACQVLLDRIEGKNVPERTLLGYEIVIKDSTKMTGVYRR